MGTVQGSVHHNRHLELYRVVECLIQIEKEPFFKTALEDATNQANITRSRMEQLTQRSDSMKMNIFQVVGFYFVFQSVMIGVVAQASTLKKDNLWCPLSLSAAVGVSCLIPVWMNGMAIAALRGDMHGEERLQKLAVTAREELRRLGTGYKFPAPDGPTSTKRSTSVYFFPYFLVCLFIISFTLLILFSQWRILSSAKST